MLGFPKLYSNKKLMTNKLLLSALLNKKYKVFNYSLDLKLSKGKKIPLLKMVYHYAVKNKEYDIAIDCVSKIIEEYKIQEKTIKYKGKQLWLKRKRMVLFYHFFKSLVKNKNKEMFKMLMQNIEWGDIYFESSKEKDYLYLLAMKHGDPEILKLILNSTAFSWYLGVVSDAEVFLKGLRTAFYNKKYLLCSIAYNSSSYLANSDKYGTAIKELKYNAISIGDFNIFEEENVVGQMKFDLGDDEHWYLDRIISRNDQEILIKIMEYKKLKDSCGRFNIYLASWNKIVDLAVKVDSIELARYCLEESNVNIIGVNTYEKKEELVLYVLNKAIFFERTSLIEVIMRDYLRYRSKGSNFNSKYIEKTRNREIIEILLKYIREENFIKKLNLLLNKINLSEKLNDF